MTNPIRKMVDRADAEQGPGPRTMAEFFRAAGFPATQARSAGQRYAGREPVALPAARYEQARAVFALRAPDLEGEFIAWQRELATPKHLREVAP